MSRYIFIHRLTGPAILLLLGTVALLHQAHVVSWNIFVPLLLILIGVIKLAERAAMANEPYPPPQPGMPQYGAPYSAQQAPSQSYPVQTGMVPTSHDFSQNPNINPNQDPNGGK